MLNKVKAFIKNFFNSIMNMASFNLLINKVKMFIKKFFDIMHMVSLKLLNIIASNKTFVENKLKIFISNLKDIITMVRLKLLNIIASNKTFVKKKVKMFIKKFFDIKNMISFNLFNIDKLKLYIKKFFYIINMVRLKLLNIIASNKTFVKKKVKMFIKKFFDIKNMISFNLLIDTLKMFIKKFFYIINMVRLKLLNIIDSNKNKSFVAPFFGYFFDNVTWFRNIVIRLWKMYTANKANLVAMLPQWVFVALFTNEELNDLDKKSNFANKEEELAKAKSFYISFFPKLVGFLAVLIFVLIYYQTVIFVIKILLWII